MFLADIPPLVAIPFGNAAGPSYVRPIPIASQIGVTPGAASFTDGFPPDTFQPISGGGAFVNGEDMNGILEHVTKWTRWQSAGGPAPFNGTFCTAIGGYPKLATVQSSTVPGVLWISAVDGNLTDPDGLSAAGWIAVGPSKASVPECEAGVNDADFVTPLGLHSALEALIPVKASVAEVLAGVNDADFVTPFGLRGLFSLSDSNHSITLGGLTLKWGTDRTFRSGEGGTQVIYPTPFPNETLAVVATQFIGNPTDHDNDSWAKVSTRTEAYFWYNYGASSSGNHCEGFDWFALGR